MWVAWAGLLVGLARASEDLRLEDVSIRECQGREQIGRQIVQVQNKVFNNRGRGGLRHLSDGCFAGSVAIRDVNFDAALLETLAKQPRSNDTLFFNRMFTSVELDLDTDPDVIEPCRRNWRPEDRGKPETAVTARSVCGGLGSCLYCGHQCSSVREEATQAGWASFKFYKRNRAGRRSQLNCGSGLRKGDRDFAVKFCLPPKEDFYRLIGITEKDFAAIFTNGKEFYVKAYVFYADRSLKAKAAEAQNAELAAEQLRERLNEEYEQERLRLKARLKAKAAEAQNAELAAEQLRERLNEEYEQERLRLKARLKAKAAEAQNAELAAEQLRERLNEEYEQERLRLKARASERMRAGLRRSRGGNGRRFSQAERDYLSAKEPSNSQALKDAQRVALASRGQLREYSKDQSIMCLDIQGNIMPSRLSKNGN